MKQRKMKKILFIAILISIFIVIMAVYFTYSNIGLKGNQIPIRTPLFLIKPVLGEPNNEKKNSENGRTYYTYANCDIWGETGSIWYSGWLWVEEIHASFYPSGDPDQKYNEILSELQKVYSEEPSSIKVIGVKESRTMRRGTTFFNATLYDNGMISLQLYVY